MDHRVVIDCEDTDEVSFGLFCEECGAMLFGRMLHGRLEVEPCEDCLNVAREEGE